MYATGVPKGRDAVTFPDETRFFCKIRKNLATRGARDLDERPSLGTRLFKCDVSFPWRTPRPGGDNLFFGFYPPGFTWPLPPLSPFPTLAGLLLSGSTRGSYVVPKRKGFTEGVVGDGEALV